MIKEFGAPSGVSGLSKKERVVVGNRSQFHAGENIQPKDVTAATDSPGLPNGIDALTVPKQRT